MNEFKNINLTFSDVGVTRGERLLFSSLNFSLSSGELIWVQGTNGIGKTTLLRLAAGLTKPDLGQIRWTKSGEDLQPESITAYQGHGNALKRQFTVWEDVVFWGDLNRSQQDKDEMLEKVGLTHQKHLHCHKLSAGQGRRLAIARLMLSEKPLWIMDEPAAAMDTAGQSLILDVINTHLGQGGAALIASHDSIRAFDGPTSVLTLAAA